MMHSTLAQQWLHDSFFTAPNSTQAADTDHLFMFILWVCIVSFFILMGAMGYFILKYRRRPGVPTIISPAHNTTIELAWSIGPLLVLVPIFFWGFHGYIGKQAAPANAEIIRVTGKKWNWSVQYDNGGAPQELVKLPTGSDVPVIYIPAGRPIKLIFTSTDVIHAFYIPDFRTKIDVIPNRYTSMWFQALSPNQQKLGPDGSPMKDKEGKPIIADHYVFCAEYCGDNHSDMWAYIRVLSETEYQKKKTEMLDVPAAIKNDPVKRGEFYAKALGCTSCHQMDPKGPAGSAPPWASMWGHTVEFVKGDPIELKDDETFFNYVRESVYNPGAKVVKGYSNAMSNFTGLVSLQQLDDLIVYMKSLSPDYKPPTAPAGDGATAPATPPANTPAATPPTNPAPAGGH
jgi:cytochrome c oxidase subunit 2